MSRNNDPYQNDDGHFHEPSLTQMNSMTGKSLFIAKTLGAEVTWGQVFMPFIINCIWVGGLCFLVMVGLSVGILVGGPNMTCDGHILQDRPPPPAAVAHRCWIRDGKVVYEEYSPPNSSRDTIPVWHVVPHVG